MDLRPIFLGIVEEAKVKKHPAATESTSFTVNITGGQEKLQSL